MSDENILLEFPEFPYWAGLQDKPGIRELPPYSLGWNEYGFIYQSTQKVIIDQVVEAYSAEGYSFITKPPGYSNWSNQLGDTMVEFAGQVLGDAQKISVLEIGAGSDYVATKLTASKDVSDYTIVDPATAGAANKQSQINFISGYFGDCDPGRESFDVIFSFNCLEHVSEPIKFLWNVRSLMKDDSARVGFIFPNIERQLLVGDFNGIVHEHMN
jgi:2-polyprenyl-3-methyl-5-hydroxy-6-metoxy-1,4-benzoquinol methylase